MSYGDMDTNDYTPDEGVTPAELRALIEGLEKDEHTRMMLSE